MHHVLRRLGFVYKKTKAVPGKADPEKQEAFIEGYKKLKERKNPEDPVYFVDGVHYETIASAVFKTIDRDALLS